MNKTILVSADSGETRVAVLESKAKGGKREVAEVYIERRSSARSPATSTAARSTTSCPAWRPPSSTSASRRTASSTSTRSSARRREAASGRAGKRIQELIKPGPGDPRAGGQGPDGDKGARLTTEHLARRAATSSTSPQGERRRASRAGSTDDERDRLRDRQGRLAPEGGRRDRPHRRRGRQDAEDIERDLDFLQRLWNAYRAQAPTRRKAPELVYQEADLPLRVAARPLHRRLREGARRLTTRTSQADRRLPQEDVAGHGRAGHALRGGEPLFEAFGDRGGDRARPSTAASTCPRAAT